MTELAGAVAGHPSRVLIADDHVVVRRGLVSLIKPCAEFRIVGEAATGLDALNLAVGLRPDIVIADYSLTELNGRDLTAALLKRMPMIEVMIYTLKDHPDFVLGALASGARGYVLKSESEAHVLAALAALSKHQPYFSGLATEALLTKVMDQKSEGSFARLSNWERDILRHVANGMTCNEISKALGLPGRRVEGIRRALKGKVGVDTTADLVRYAIRNGLVDG